MITIPVEDLVFVICALIGGTLLLVTVVFDDILGGILDALHVGFDVGGTSLAPLLLAFISMFGVGGLFSTQLLRIHGGNAALVGTGFGIVGALAAYAMFNMLRQSESPRPFSTTDLIGRSAYVAVHIPAGHFGSVYVKAEGQTHEYSATAAVDVPSGSLVDITGVAGPGLIVTPAAAVTAPQVPPGVVEGGSKDA